MLPLVDIYKYALGSFLSKTRQTVVLNSRPSKLLTVNLAAWSRGRDSSNWRKCCAVTQPEVRRWRPCCASWESRYDAGTAICSRKRAQCGHMVFSQQRWVCVTTHVIAASNGRHLSSNTFVSVCSGVTVTLNACMCCGLFVHRRVAARNKTPR